MSSQATTGSDFTSKSSLEFGEDVKKRLRLLSEELLLAQKREETTYVFVRHFFCFQKCFSGIAFISFRLSRIFAKKMAEEEGFEPSESCPSAVFKTAALNHSTILPHGYFLNVQYICRFYNTATEKNPVLFIQRIGQQFLNTSGEFRRISHRAALQQ